MWIRSRLAPLALGMALLAENAPCQAQTFTLLTPLPDSPEWKASGISANGHFITGYCFDPKTGSNTTVVWDKLGNVTPLPLHGQLNQGFEVSDSGTRVAGEGDGAAIVWGGGPGGDALLPPGSALGLNSDGTVAVGYLYGVAGSLIGFASIVPMAPIILPPPDPDIESVGEAVVPDGSRIAGHSSRYESNRLLSRAVVWEGSTPTPLPQLPGHTIAAALDISADGRVVVGNSACCVERPALPVRWVDGVPHLLDPTPQSGTANACSADGSTIVGEAVDGAFVWDEAHGLRYLGELLTAAGIDLSNVSLASALDVSGDGRTIVGSGFNLNTFSPIGWKVTLGTPCPADFNADGKANSQDFFDFLAAFFVQDPRADFNGDHVVNSQDFFDFLAAFFAGC